MAAVAAADTAAPARRQSTRVIKRVRLDDCIVPPDTAGPLHHRTVDPAAKKAAETHGPWLPEDDLLLIEAIQQTPDPEVVAREVRFSRPRSAAAVRERWLALLYDADLSKAAMERLQARPGAAAVLTSSNVPWSQAELAHLVPAVSRSRRSKTGVPRFSPSDATQLLQTGLDEGIFHASRTVASVTAMMQRMWYEQNRTETFPPLPVAQLPPRMQDMLERATTGTGPQGSGTGRDGPAGTFPPASATSDVNEEKEALAVWLRRRRRMQHLEAEIAADRFFELGKRTLAVLQGEFARFEMRSKEVVLGRAVDGAPVDFDLSKAGPATRVSARQALIRFDVDCRFHLLNLGHRAIYVCGEPVPTHCKVFLSDGDLIEIGDLPFIFHENNWLVSKARRYVLPGEEASSGEDE